MKAIEEDIDLYYDQYDNKIIPSLVERTQGDISDYEYDNEVEVIKLPIEEANNANEGDEEFQKFTMTRSGRVVKTKTNYDLATMDLTQV